MTALHSPTINLDEDNSEITVSIDRVFFARSKCDIDPSAPTVEHQSAKQAVSSETTSVTSLNEVEYVIDKISGHDGLPADGRFSVR